MEIVRSAVPAVVALLGIALSSCQKEAPDRFRHDQQATATPTAETTLDTESLAGTSKISRDKQLREIFYSEICQDDNLLEAMRIINRACAETTCNFARLKQLNAAVNKSTLLSTLRNPQLRPVHLFYPSGKSNLEDVFDWETFKKDQLDSLKATKLSDAVVFVLGRASLTGNRKFNEELSQERMRNIFNYLKNTLKLDCPHFRGAYFGNELLYLFRSDSALLGLEPTDWRDDELILNQAVHVFVFPCHELIVG